MKRADRIGTHLVIAFVAGAAAIATQNPLATTAAGLAVVSATLETTRPR